MAEIDGGGLHFTGGFDNKAINKAIEEAENRIKGMSSEFSKAGDEMDAQIHELVQSFELQKIAVKGLQDEYRSLRSEQSKFALGSTEHEQLGKQIEAVRHELMLETQSLDELQSKLKQAAEVSIATGQSLESIGGSRRAIAELKGEIEASTTRIANFKDTTVKGSGEIDSAFSSVGQKIQETFQKLDAVTEANRAEIKKLTAEYGQLGIQAKNAFSQGNDKEYHSIENRRRAIEGEIATRKSLLSEVEKEVTALDKSSKAFDKMHESAKRTANAQVMLRTELNQVKNEMAQLDRAGLRNSAQYQELTKRAEELSLAMYSANQQIKTLTNVKGATLQGIVSGLSGVAGAFSAATGAVSLFAGENENLQKIMVRVQSLMAITVGLQQVQAALNKDSAFQMMILANAKRAYASSMAVSNRAAQMGITTNVGLAASFRAVSAAIKTIPVFGWIVAGISALAGVVSLLSKNTREAKKTQEEFAKAVSEGAYKSIGAIETLSIKWNKLGDDLNAKTKFIDENKRAFEDLGIAIRDVADAEKLLNEGKDAFINAQIAKAKALALVESKEYKKQMKKSIDARSIIDSESEAFKKRTGKDVTYRTNDDGTERVVEGSKKLYNAVEDMQKADKKIRDIQQQSLEYWGDYNKGMNEAGDQTGKIIEGTIAYYEKAISDNQSKLKNFLPGSDDFKQTVAEIESLQKKLDAITNRNSKGGKSDTKDPFAEALSKAKEEYSKYLSFTNSTDEQIRASAQDTFRKQLEQGGSYIEFLTKKKEELLKGDQTAETIHRIKLVNEQIANETQKQGDNEIKRQNEHLQQLVENYYLYYDTRKKIEEEFNFDMIELNAQLLSAQGDAQKEFVQTMIDNRTRTYNRDMKSAGSGDPEYDALVKSYQDFETFEEKKLRITEKYAEERAKAIEKGDTALVDRLNKSEQKDLQQLSFDEILGSDTWAQLFGNLDQLTVDKMIELRNKIESEWSNLDLTPEQFNAIRNKIDEVTDAIQSKNPFKALLDSINRYKKGEKGVDFKEIAKSAGASISLVSGAFDAVVDGLADIGIAGDETTQKLLSDIGSMVSSAGDLAMGIASGNPLQIIQSSISLLTSALEVFNVKDRRAERQIAKHAENVKNLEKSYIDLEKAVNKALGSDKYKSSQDAIKNLEKQQKELAKQADLERGKKKSDKGKVEEYENALQSAKDKQKELVQQLRDDILSIDAKSAAEQLGQAFIDAFKAGEDGIEAFGKKADDIVGNIMQKMLVQKLLEQPLGNIMDKYSKKWINDKGDFLGFDAVIKDADAMGKEMSGLGEGFARAMENLPDEIKKYFTGEQQAMGETAPLSGAIKGVSEETATKLGGQMNAIRINQLEATELIRQQLMHLSVIAINTGYIKSIDDRMARMEASSGSLRSQGLSA